MIKLKTILKEDELQDKFGDIAFGMHQDISMLQGKSEIERNTEFEDKVLEYLHDWVGVYRNSASEKLWQNYELFKKAKIRYPGIFSPSTPNGTKLYRGLSRYGSHFVDRIMEADWKKWEMAIQIGGEITWWKYEIPISYTPTNEVQSWSSSSTISEEFAMYRGNEWMVGDSHFVMLLTTQNDEYLFNSRFLSHLATEYWKNTVNEEETLHFGKSYKDPVYVLVNDDFYLHLKNYQNIKLRSKRIK